MKPKVVGKIFNGSPITGACFLSGFGKGFLIGGGGRVLRIIVTALTKRNDFPVGVTPQLQYVTLYVVCCLRIHFVASANVFSNYPIQSVSLALALALALATMAHPMLSCNDYHANCYMDFAQAPRSYKLGNLTFKTSAGRDISLKRTLSLCSTAAVHDI